MFFTAAEMAIGAYARGAREAGLLSLPLSILAMAAGYATFPLDARGIADWYYYVPLLNAAALVKELATDIIIPAHIMLVTLSLLLCSAAFVAMCAGLLSGEKSLLRG